MGLWGPQTFVLFSPPSVLLDTASGLRLGSWGEDRTLIGRDPPSPASSEFLTEEGGEVGEKGSGLKGVSGIEQNSAVSVNSS